MRERAVRKLVRAIIETGGGDGAILKPDIETQYRKGIVWWHDKRVAEWSGVDMKMKFLPGGVQVQSVFEKLLTSE